RPRAAMAPPMALVGPARSLRTPCGVTRKPVTMRSKAIALPGFIAGMGFRMVDLSSRELRLARDFVAHVDEVDVGDEVPREREVSGWGERRVDVARSRQLGAEPAERAARPDPGTRGATEKRELGSQAELHALGSREVPVRGGTPE